MTKEISIDIAEVNWLMMATIHKVIVKKSRNEKEMRKLWEWRPNRPA